MGKKKDFWSIICNNNNGDKNQANFELDTGRMS